MRRCHVYLVPGFFGFKALGNISYFHRVGDTLVQQLADRGITARVDECRTNPAGSIRGRAEELLQHVIDTGGLEAEELCFVGHSTGGLDIRLLLAPNVSLRADRTEAEVAARTRHVVTVATPHYGSPLADFFTLIPGRQMLQALSKVVTSGFGRVGIWAAARAVALVAGVDGWVRRDSMLDAVSRSLLRHLTLRPDDPVFDFVRQVSVDQAAIIQITPECMDLFNAAVAPHPDVDYGCVVTGTPMPLFRYGPTDLLSAERLALGGLYICIWALTAREHKAYPYPTPPWEVAAQISAALGDPDLSGATNDGIVPTLSQVYGDLICAVPSDHYDVLGRFDTDATLGDWLPSGTAFNEATFLSVWDQVAARLASDVVGHVTPRARGPALVA
ncbi:MAG TPA: hypothetical protein VGQ83_32930 [Polyangia bacterium]|jgi:hypothetical protein